MYLLSFEIYKTMNLLLPLHKLFTNQMRTRLQEKNAVPVKIICIWSENLLNRKPYFLKKTMSLLKKANSFGNSKNSLLKFNQQINIMASESHHSKMVEFFLLYYLSLIYVFCKLKILLK